MLLFWGRDLIQFYNDAFRPSLASGGRHPRGLGMPAREFWSDVWHLVGQQIDDVMGKGKTTSYVDRLVPIERNGRLEEVYWTYSYSPVLDDDNMIGGTLVVCQETTQTVITARRAETLHRVAALPRQQTEASITAEATRILAQNELDVPAVLCFVRDAVDAHAYTLECDIGIPADRPHLRDPAFWKVEAAVDSRSIKLIDLSREKLPPRPHSWPEPITMAAVVPLENPWGGGVVGALVVGVSSGLQWNKAYEEFVVSAARDIATQVTTWRAELERERLLESIALEKNRLEYTFRQAPTFLAVLRGPQHVYELANDAYLELVGGRDIIGKPLLEAFPELKDQQFDQLIDRVLNTGETFVGHDLPATLRRRPDGPLETIYVDLTYSPFIEPDGTRSGVIAHGIETTQQVAARAERERLLAEAQEARAEAEAANRAKSDFLAIMSHELRTPLNAIGGYTELLELEVHGPITDQQRYDLGRIQASQRHLLGLINEVLNYARLETGTVRYDLQPIDPRVIVNSAQALVMPQVASKGLTLTVRDFTADARVMADAEKLRQILVNLLSNALKFTERGGAITITGQRHGDKFHIVIEDTGIGIPPDKIEAIFEPFVQVRADLTRTAEGTGLGLAISRDLALGMGGNLSAESELGKGSRFTLVLPAA